MMHYNEQGKIKEQKKIYKPKAGQYSLNMCLHKFEDRGETAVTKELRQFNSYNVFEPIYAESLADKEKQQALTSLIFLKEKQKWRHESKILCERECSEGSCGKRQGSLANSSPQISIYNCKH
jgi:hypothetical protein